MLDEATYRRRQAKGAYKGGTWDAYHAAEVENERALGRMRAEQKQIGDDFSKHVLERRKQRERNDAFWRPVLKGLTTVADVAAEVAPYAGPLGKVASVAYKSFAPPGSRHYKRTWSEKLGSLGREAIAAVVPGGRIASKIDALRQSLPSAACGGRVARGGRVRVHKAELVVRKGAAPRLIKLMKRSGVALPLSAIRAKAKSK